MDWIHPRTFRRIVTRHHGDYKVQSFSCWDQFLYLAFARLTYPESLRDIEVYAKRWQIELFFRWIKQNPRIKTFYGTSDNAVKTQVWIALCVYVLVAIVKKELQLPRSLYEIPRILSVTPFEPVPLQELLAMTYDPTRNPCDYNQLPL
jgi:hypothetical protein